MPLTQAQPDAAARVYAKSLFELAQNKGGQSAIEETLGELEDIVELARANPRFGEFLSSPSIPADHRAAALSRILKGRASDLTIRFLQVLNEKGRLGAIITMTAAFDELAQERFGRVEVDVYTAEKLDPDQLAAVRKRLADGLRKDVVLHTYVEPAMIGGVKFRIGDQLVDGSISTQLRKLKDQLLTEGGAAMRANIARSIDDAAGAA